MTAKEYLLNYILTDPENLENGEPIFSTIKEFIYEIDGEEIYNEIISENDYWAEIFRVIQIEDKYIGFVWSKKTHPDVTPYECGWRFYEDSICFVEPYTVEVTKYRKI